MFAIVPRLVRLRHGSILHPVPRYARRPIGDSSFRSAPRGNSKGLCLPPCAGCAMLTGPRRGEGWACRARHKSRSRKRLCRPAMPRPLRRPSPTLSARPNAKIATTTSPMLVRIRQPVHNHPWRGPNGWPFAALVAIAQGWRGPDWLQHPTPIVLHISRRFWPDAGVAGFLGELCPVQRPPLGWPWRIVASTLPRAGRISDRALAGRAGAVAARRLTQVAVQRQVLRLFPSLWKGRAHHPHTPVFPSPGNGTMMLQPPHKACWIYRGGSKKCRACFKRPRRQRAPDPLRTTSFRPLLQHELAPSSPPSWAARASVPTKPLRHHRRQARNFFKSACVRRRKPKQLSRKLLCIMSAASMCNAWRIAGSTSLPSAKSAPRTDKSAPAMSMPTRRNATTTMPGVRKQCSRSSPSGWPPPKRHAHGCS